MNNSKQIIKDYLVNNRDHIIQLFKPIIEQKDKLLKDLPPEFKKDINEQYLYALKQVLVQELSEAKLEYISIEDITIAVQSLNLQFYIDSDVMDIK